MLMITITGDGDITSGESISDESTNGENVNGVNTGGEITKAITIVTS
jgi:hypothetical protein